MYCFGLGTEGNILKNVIINDSNTTAGPAFVLIPDHRIVTIQFITRSIVGAFTGNWKIEASNNVTPAASGSWYGQAQGNAGDWTDITAIAWVPAFTAAVSTATTQMANFPSPGYGGRALRVSLARTSGAGTGITADVWLSAKQ